MSKHFYFNQFSLALGHSLVLFDPIKCYPFGPEWTREQWQWSSILHSLTIRLFNVISRTLVGGGLTSLQRSSRCILQPQPTEKVCVCVCVCGSFTILLQCSWGSLCDMSYFVLVNPKYKSKRSLSVYASAYTAYIF